MMTMCVRDPVVLRQAGRREGIGRFDGGRMSSDGGAPLEAAVEVSQRSLARYAAQSTMSRWRHSKRAVTTNQGFVRDGIARAEQTLAAMPPPASDTGSQGPYGSAGAGKSALRGF